MATNYPIILLLFIGNVECDASVMDGRSLRHGAVGAVPGVRNPVLLARQILEAQSGPLPGGLVPPRFVFYFKIATVLALTKHYYRKLDWLFSRYINF